MSIIEEIADMCIHDHSLPIIPLQTIHQDVGS